MRDRELTVFFQLGGCLWRFGDITPDAIAAVCDVKHVASRARSGSEAREIRLEFFEECDIVAALDRDERDRLTKFLDVSPESFVDVPGFDELNPDPADIVVTTSGDVYRRCREKNLWGIFVSDAPGDGEMYRRFDEIGRTLEERLRLPTARPMSPDARKGGLQAIDCASVDDTYEIALRAIADDRNADWIILDSTLILYLEDSDADDRIQADRESHRVSYSINKLALGITWNAGYGGDAALLRIGGYRLLQLADGRADWPDSEMVIRWNALRRSRLTSGNTNLEASERAPSISLGINPALAASLDEAVGRQPEITAAWIRAGTESRVALTGATADSKCVSWTSATELGSVAGISVWIYRGLRGFDRDAMSMLIALNHWLRSFSARSHVLHCVLFGEPDLDCVLQQLLFDDERNRLVSIVEFGDVSVSASAAQRAIVASVDHQPMTWFVPAALWQTATAGKAAPVEMRSSLLDALTTQRGFTQ